MRDGRLGRPAYSKLPDNGTAQILRLTSSQRGLKYFIQPVYSLLTLGTGRGLSRYTATLGILRYPNSLSQSTYIGIASHE